MRTRVELDREDQASHTITVTATDPSNRTDTVATTNTVEDVDETPEVTGETNPEFDENESGIVAFYTSTDPDHKGIEWVLNGTDSDDFTLSGGTLTFNVVPDFEDPADSNRDNRYQATIEAREQGDGTSVGRLSVTVQVTNVDEPGVVEVPVTYPRVGQRLTPTIVDPDEGVGSIKWKWESSPDGTNWTPIQGATSRSYTSTRDDDGKILRVTVIYRDRQGPGKTLTHEFDNPVVLRPYFDADTATRIVPENTNQNQDVGGRFTARHPDNINLTYAVIGPDARFFTVDSASGQLRTSATPLDYESHPGHEAEVQITATDINSLTATITVTIAVTDECVTAGEPPCAPTVSSASATSLRVSWSAPAAEDHDLQYREFASNTSWTPIYGLGAGRSYTIAGLTTGTEYEVQVRTVNEGNPGSWSPSSTGTPRTHPPHPEPGPVSPTTTTGTTTTTATGGGGFALPAPPAPPAPRRPAADFQPVSRLFQQLTSGGSLLKVWRLVPLTQRWLFYDPDPRLAPFNSLKTVNLASDPPAVVAVSVNRGQRFRGYILYTGWNFIPLTSQPLTTQAGSRTEPVAEYFEQLIKNRTLRRIWWFDSRNQEWKFFDPKPELECFNTLNTIDLSSNPPVVLVVQVSRQQDFRGNKLHAGWNHIVIR